MAEANEQRIARLMAEGLDAYGQDLIDRAVACWRAVLKLDPHHEVARDYLEAAGFEPQAPAQPAARAALAREARSVLDKSGDAEALDLLEAATREAPADLEAQAALDLVRASLYRKHRLRTKDGSGVPRVKLGPQEILKFNLPAYAGFVLSMVDGHTSVDELVALTNMDPFEALHMLGKLMDNGLVEVRA
jgi:hypothetical protein